jgi:SpoVK/Ycf46/Vps4 family AAA+-type ATPase
VLLLDEADVFLSQRSKQDMKRNALVSVFLRVLEYYNGLLFLTTNRVGTIDEAFKSRIHLSLYYPPLDKTQTRDIFRLNIAKLKVIEQERSRMTGEPALVIKEREVLEFADKHYEELARSTGCWNGRQIRSAFQIASSLALYAYTNAAQEARDRGQQPPAAPMLDRALFEKVQLSTQSFDRHMKKESGGMEMEIPRRGSFHQDY